MPSKVLITTHIDQFGRRVLALVEAELADIDTTGVEITIAQTAEVPHPTITIVHPRVTRTFQIAYEEQVVHPTDKTLKELVQTHIRAALGEMPAPKKGYCCAHRPSCAIHQPPHDAAYVKCSCGDVAGRPRHRWSPSDLQFVSSQNDFN